MRSIKNLFLILMMVLCIGMLPVNVRAASVSQDGLEITLKTDKESYGGDEEITATLTVKNTNDIAVTNVSLEQFIPDGYKLSKGSLSSKQVESLGAGETIVLTITYTPATISADGNGETGESSSIGNEMQTGTENSTLNLYSRAMSPQTGDKNNIVMLILSAICLIVFIAWKTKRGKQFLSLFLCCVLLSTLFFPEVVQAASDQYKSCSTETVIKVDGTELKITAKVTYNTGNTVEQNNVTVSFDLNYEGAGIYKTVSVGVGGKVTQPEDPVRSGYSFEGWYDVASGGQKFDFNTTITQATILYAHWSENVAESDNVTVSFDLNYEGAGIYKTVSVGAGGKVALPETPVRSGYSFEGWYDEANGGREFDFNAAITQDIILYAHWNIVEVGDGAYRITFDKNDGSASVYQVQLLNAGATVSKPIDPTRKLYRFTGWYLESAAVTEYDFSIPVVSDLTLYAGWGNPDGSEDSLYAASDELETIYSITGINVIGNNVDITYNTNSQCLMVVEFFEDQMSGSDWSEEAQKSNLSATPIATASGYTEDYGEMITIILPIDGSLPDNFVVRATLYGTGKDEDPVYVSNQYTATYKEFEAQTVDSVIETYGEDLVINFDSNRTTNFGVLKESVKVITTESLDAGFEVIDIDIEDEVVPDHHFIFTNADAHIRNLQVGDVIYIEGTTWLFKIGTVSNDDGTVILTQDKDALMTDFYDVLQVDMEASDADVASNDNGVAPQWEIIDIDGSLSGSFNPSVSYKFENGITLTGSIAGKITGNVKMSYDAHLFSADYFECSVSFVTEVSAEVKASMSTDNTNEWKNVVYQFDTRGIKLPTPITGLDVYAKPSAKLDWKLSGSVSVKAVSKQTSGFEYNSDVGRTDIKKKENKVSVMAEGKAEVKIGPNIDIGVELLGGVLNAGVTAEAGAKFTATAETGADDLLNNANSKHACGLCVSGKAEWYATAAVKCGYKITDKLKGDIAKLTILDFTAPIYFVPNVPAEFFVSVLNSVDSPFGGAIKFGGGSCTNKTYRTEFQVLDENGQQINGIEVSVVRQNQTSSNSGMSPYVIYLYEGTYKASASLNGTDVSKTFVVSNGQQIVPLSLRSADSLLEGTIVDTSNHSIVIEGASIKISKDGVVVASGESNNDGKFSIAVPEGSLKVEISKDGYTPFTSTETIYNGENHSMGLIELIFGTGMGGFHGVIRDAIDNTPISGVTLNLYDGWNSPAEANTAIRTLITNDDGEFRYDTVTLFGKVHGLPSGNYTLTASREGYSDTSYNIMVYPGTTDENPGISETMSPSMNEDYYRIILTWGSTPEDLDSHLVAGTDTEYGIHVFYQDMNPSPYYANLDVDDTTSYGPETITITNFEGLNNIRYAVHDYTNRSLSDSTALSYSGAVVRIFKGDRLLRTFQCPAGYGGTEWEVFSLDSNGEITTINDMRYTEEPTNILGNDLDMQMIGEPVGLKDYEISEKTNEGSGETGAVPDTGMDIVSGRDESSEETEDISAGKERREETKSIPDAGMDIVSGRDESFDKIEDISAGNGGSKETGVVLYMNDADVRSGNKVVNY